MTEESEGLTSAAKLGLDPSSEHGWRQFRRQLDLADGFWLGFVFCRSRNVAGVLERRTRQILRSRVQEMRIIEPASPQELSSILPLLLCEETAQSHCVWLTAIHSDSPGLREDEDGPWALAWDNFLLRANEHRDQMRRMFQGALILAATPDVKPRVRDAAPDLWSVRSLVLDLQPNGGLSREQYDQNLAHGGKRISDAFDSSFDPTTNADFLSAEVERIARRVETGNEHRPHGLVRLRLREVEGLLKQGKTQEAAHVAQKNVELLRGRSDAEYLLAYALEWSSAAALADGDFAVSREHIEEAVRIRRDALSDHGESHQSLRDLSVSLGRAGDVRREAGDLAGATASYEESLALNRRLVDGYGASPQSLRDLSIGLSRIGDVRREAGDLAGATASYGESLALNRQLVDGHGASPQSLRDLSLNLGRLGDVQREAGDLAGATALYEECLALSRRLVDGYGDIPQLLHDLSVSLGRVGSVRREAGDLAGATIAKEESKILQRRLKNRSA